MGGERACTIAIHHLRRFIMATPAYYYLITNRKYNNIFKTFEDTVSDTLTYLCASVPATGAPTYQIVDYDAWKTNLQNDIKNMAGSGAGQALVFVHGFDVSFPTAEGLFQKFLQHLWTLGRYNGPIVLFDWPSNGLFEPAKQRATETGTTSFPLLKGVLSDIVSTGAELSIMCHSMGNFAMQQGASSLAGLKASQVLLVAAELENTSFNPGTGSKTDANDIIQIGARVTAYFSTHDNVLPVAAKLDGYPELGLSGPVFTDSFYSDFYAVDCSQVVNQQNSSKYGAPQIHESYFYIPQVLTDFVAMMNGASESGAPNRTPISGTNGVGFTMTPVSQVSQ
jgi:esterase/lipase superfamily enzyme